MANHKSAAKRARQSIVRNERASAAKKTIRTFEKKIRTAIEAKDKESAGTLLVTYSSKSDKAAAKGYLHRKQSSRKVSRLSTAISTL